MGKGKTGHGVAKHTNSLHAAACAGAASAHANRHTHPGTRAHLHARRYGVVEYPAGRVVENHLGVEAGVTLKFEHLSAGGLACHSKPLCAGEPKCATVLSSTKPAPAKAVEDFRLILG